MEENHQQHTQSSNSDQEARSSGNNDEIKIAMLLVEENTRNLYETSSQIGSIQTLKTLIEEDKDMVQNVAIFCSHDTENNPLQGSVLHDHLDSTRLLLDHNPELAVRVNAIQHTPLHLASQNGDLELVRALLRRSTSACLVRDLNGLIPLHHAVIRGQVEIMKELVRAQPRSVWTKLKNGQTVLHLCVEDDHLEIMKLLIEIFLYHDEDFLDTTDDTGSTILDMTLKLRRFEMLEYLLSISKVRWGKMLEEDEEEAPNVTKTSKKGSIQQSKRRRGSKKTRDRRCRILNKINLKCKGDWVQEVQGTLMLVATVIATVTFQGTIDPPGGTWQQDHAPTSCNSEAGFSVQAAGTSIMACKSFRIYISYLVANSISFLASVAVILLIVSGFPWKNRIFGWLLSAAMTVAVAFLTLAYLNGTAMVCENKSARAYLLVLLRVWYGVVGLVILCCIIIPFSTWVAKKLPRVFASP